MVFEREGTLRGSLPAPKQEHEYSHIHNNVIKKCSKNATHTFVEKMIRLSGKGPVAHKKLFLYQSPLVGYDTSIYYESGFILLKRI